jgi:hypothetical protein
MKKVILLTCCVVLLLAATSAYAAEKYALGKGNVALKVDYFSFTDDVFEDIDLESGVYVGLEGSLALMPNLYLALESGWAGTSNDDDILGDDDTETDTNANNWRAGAHIGIMF